jgi:class 3 adenylate cyclase
MSASLAASVVFLRIHDFARRAASEQARLRAQLEAVVAVTTAEIEPLSRIVLEASDGVAIVVLRDPQGALRLAQRALTSSAAGLPLSAGLNHGAVQLAGRKGGEGMTGDGIAVAANVAEFASASRLLASRAFRDALADAAPGLEAVLVPAGTFNDPGLRTHELFGPDATALRRRGRRYTLACVALAMALIGAGLAWRISVVGQEPFVNAMLDKVPYFRALVLKVNY